MSYTPPNVLSASTVLTSSDVQGNVDALQIYLHSGIIAGDLEAAQFADTRNVQPPTYEPWTQVQHGVTGHQGAQWGGSSQARLTFATSYLTGNGQSTMDAASIDWLEVPNSSFKIVLRQAAKLVFHWYVELEAGPDNIPAIGGRTFPVLDRLGYITPYIGSTDFRESIRAQEVQNTQDGYSAAYPIGSRRCFTVAGGYGQRDGTMLYDAPLGETVIGLCSYSQIDRIGVINWAVAIEIFYQ